MTPMRTLVDPAVRSWLRKFEEIDYYDFLEFITEDSEQPFHLLIDKQIYYHWSKSKLYKIISQFDGAPIANNILTEKGNFDVFVFPNSQLCWHARLTVGDNWTYHGTSDDYSDCIDQPASCSIQSSRFLQLLRSSGKPRSGDS